MTARPKTDRYGQNSVPNRAHQIQNLLPREIKVSANSYYFRLTIKQWRCLECPCTLCKIYLPNLRYLQGRSLLASFYFASIRL